jgi:phosphoglycolate phosphatase
MSGFEVIVFDYDGTLFDTRPAIIHCIRRAFAKRGRPVPEIEAVANVVTTGLPLQGALFALDRNLRGDQSTFNDLVGLYRTLYRDEGTPLLKPFAGTEDTLQLLHAAGAINVVVSNKGIAAIHQSLDQCRLSGFVDVVFGDEPGLPKKPDPAIILDHILPRYVRLQKERILMVGDTEVDIVFAKNAGISCCWASYGYGDAGRCRTLRPEHEIGGITELPALVHCS